MAAEETDAETTSANAVRTAVVVVHGMGEQRPMDTLDGFVKTALRPRSVDGGQNWDYYYSRPAVITGSYEARRYISRHLGSFTGPDGEEGAVTVTVTSAGADSAEASAAR